MIAILLLQYLRNRSRYNWHMSNLAAFIRIHLMSHIDLWTRLNQMETSGGGHRRKCSINGDIEGIENAHARKTERFHAL